MKKSSLITIAFASLVGLAGCNAAPAAPAKSRTENAMFKFADSFFRKSYSVDDEGYFLDKDGNRIPDGEGGYYRVDIKNGESKEELFVVSPFQTYFLDTDAVDEMEYYKIPGSVDSYAFVFEYFDGVTAAELAQYNDIILHNTCFAVFDAFFEEDITKAETLTPVLYDMRYLQQEDGLNQMVGLIDEDEDGTNDFGHIECINAYGEGEEFEDIVLYFDAYSYVYSYEEQGSTLYGTFCQVCAYAVPEDVQFQ